LTQHTLLPVVMLLAAKIMENKQLLKVHGFTHLSAVSELLILPTKDNRKAF